MDDEIVKKRRGFPRELARKKLEKFFKDNPPFKIPIPIFEVAKYFGFEIHELGSLNENQRGIIVKSENRKLIGLNSSYHMNNKRYTVGHEMAHDFLGHPPEEECDSDEEIKVYNQEAEEFAAEMLIPFAELKKQIKKTSDLDELAKIFQVSKQAIFIKISSQGLFNKL